MILDLCAKTSYQHDPDSAYPDYFSGAVTIHTRDGRTLHHREQMNRGSAENPMSDSDIKEKFLGNATRTISTTQAEIVMRLVLEIEHAPDLESLANALTK